MVLFDVQKKRLRIADLLVTAPILGDRKYTSPNHYTERELVSRRMVPTSADTMCLHAAELTFWVSP